ncbi:DUF6891 domain-containing protein [Alienimonas sp. DA493]|uniref:DUF6891 domain-containing protein n=1 Tax=Alienimonas sp. DA493 TaxID=3373605 RepID=UPI00375460BD
MPFKFPFADRFFPPARGPAGEATLPPDVADDLRRYVREYVRAGFLPAEDIPAQAADVLLGEADAAVLLKAAEGYLAQEVAAHAAEQVDWPAVTDCDRLDAAFAALEAAGVVCRQNFSCCGNCGVAEIGAEMDGAAAAGKRIRGYAFYHMQDTESAVDGYGLCLNYGPRWEEGLTDADYAPRATAIGREVAAALADAGLAVDWDGSLNRRISVTLDWKRRQPATA